MAEPVTIAKTAATVLKMLLTTDGDGNSGAKKVAIGIVIATFCFFGVMYVAAQIRVTAEELIIQLIMPPGVREIVSLVETLPESVREAKAIVDSVFSKPVVSTGQDGIVPFPVAISTISSYYGSRDIPGMPERSFHEGIDFPVAFGSEVMAIAPGKVVETGVSADYGNYIMIRHEMIRLDEDGEEIERETFYSFYAHLYRVYVFEGQTVEQGLQIAASGGDPTKHFSGNSTGPHLHLEVRRTMEYSSHFDPYDYVLDPNPFDGDTKSVRWGIVA